MDAVVVACGNARRKLLPATLISLAAYVSRTRRIEVCTVIYRSQSHRYHLMNVINRIMKK